MADTRKPRHAGAGIASLPAGSKDRLPCLILGCGGHGRVVLDVLANEGRHDVLGFIDSDPRMVGRRIDGIEVLGQPNDMPRIRDEVGAHRVIVAVGDNGARRALADRLESAGFELINAIHPSANIAQNVRLGHNIVICAGALVCAHCQIGDSVILNTGSIVDHETLIGTATHICPGARLAGRVTVESGAFVGIGATIIQCIRVGYEAVIGAGAVVINDVAAMSTVVGVPAREVTTGRQAGYAGEKTLNMAESAGWTHGWPNNPPAPQAPPAGKLASPAPDLAAIPQR